VGVGRGPAVRRIGLHQAEDQLHQEFGKVGVASDLEPFGETFPPRPGRGHILEEVGDGAGEQEADVRAEAVEIRRHGGRGTLYLLEGREAGGAHAAGRPAVRLGMDGELQVDETELLVGTHHDLVGREIPEDEPSQVGDVQQCGQAFGHAEGVGDAPAPAAGAEPVEHPQAQGHPGHPLLGEEEVPALLEGREQPRRDGVLVERLQGPGLGSEEVAHVVPGLVDGDVGARFLEDRVAAGPAVDGPVNAALVRVLDGLPDEEAVAHQHAPLVGCLLLRSL
jgi:hypothetical protein